jgi:hypothetical protein
MSRLGPLFEDGDPQAARERYEQAAAGGEPQAMFISPRGSLAATGRRRGSGMSGLPPPATPVR